MDYISLIAEKEILNPDGIIIIHIPKEDKYIEEMDIKREDYIPIIKQNSKGNVIKLKVMNRYKKLEIDILDEEKDPITHDELEKYDKINCLI